jgi:hypothetical protein
MRSWVESHGEVLERYLSAWIKALRGPPTRSTATPPVDLLARRLELDRPDANEPAVTRLRRVIELPACGAGRPVGRNAAATGAFCGPAVL